MGKRPTALSPLQQPLLDVLFALLLDRLDTTAGVPHRPCLCCPKRTALAAAAAAAAPNATVADGAASGTASVNCPQRSATGHRCPIDSGVLHIGLAVLPVAC